MKKLTRRWELGLIKESIEDVVLGKPVHFVKIHNPYKDRWFADPFILDVTETQVVLLVEEFADDVRKGRIAKLVIDKSSWTIVDVRIILEEPTHLSFPAILRKNNQILVYPENARSGELKLYKLMGDRLVYVKTICDAIIWDSVITNFYDSPKLFTAHQDDKHLDIYDWNTKNEKFEYVRSIVSKENNMRMAGDIWALDGKAYCVNQVCNRDYGEAVEIKEIMCDEDGGFKLKPIRRITPPTHLLYSGMHTLNIYKGIIVVDFHVWNSVLALLVNKIVKCKKMLSKWLKMKK